VTRNSCNIAIFGAKYQPINDQSKMQKRSDINIHFEYDTIQIIKGIRKQA
jgi:hypothetical protein